MLKSNIILEILIIYSPTDTSTLKYKIIVHFLIITREGLILTLSTTGTMFATPKIKYQQSWR